MSEYYEPFQIEDATGRKTTYRELIVTVKRLGATLLTHGLRPGEIISICAPNSIEHVFLFYAVSRIGAILHFVNPDDSEGMSENKTEKISLFNKYLNLLFATYL